MKINFLQAVTIATRMQAFSITAANRSAFRQGRKGKEIGAISIATERFTDVGRYIFFYLIMLTVVNNFTGAQTTNSDPELVV